MSRKNIVAGLVDTVAIKRPESGCALGVERVRLWLRRAYWTRPEGFRPIKECVEVDRSQKVMRIKDVH